MNNEPELRKNLKRHKQFAAIFALILIAGETVVVATTNKYWPLALDDYILCASLLLAAYVVKESRQAPALMVIWALMIGNLYAMLFGRMDPVHGSGERLEALAILLLLTIIGLLWSARIWRSSAIPPKEP